MTFMMMVFAIALGTAIASVILTVTGLFVMTRKTVMKKYFKWIMKTTEQMSEWELEEDDELHLVD